MEYLKKFAGDYEKDKNSHPDRVSGTGFWLYSDALFRAWRRSRDACVLHLVGRPSCGKSVLIKGLIDDDLATYRHTAAACYYFFTRGNARRTTAASVMAALLHQLCSQQRALGNDNLGMLDPTLDLEGYHLERMGDVMWENILSICDRLEKNIICVLDGLDECNEEDRDIILGKLSAFYSSARAHMTKVKFLITSRSDGDISFDVQSQGERRIFALLNADEKLDTMGMEMNRVMRSKMRRMRPPISEDVQDAIIARLKGIENKTYLLLDLILDQITAGSTRSAAEVNLDKIFSEIPHSVEGNYECILNRSPDYKRTRNLLAIVLAARPAMSLQEIQFACNLFDGAYEDLDQLKESIDSDDVFRHELRRLCGLLVVIEEDKVCFYHPSMRDYLVHLIDTNEPASTWKNSISLETAHFQLALACFRFLHLFNTIPYPFATRGDGPPDDDILEWLEEQGFLKHAAGFWPFHYRYAGTKYRSELLPWLPKLLAETKNKECSWISAYAIAHDRHRHVPYIVDLLLFLVRNDLDDRVEHLLETDKTLMPFVCILAVRAAAGRGNKFVVRKLLDYLTAQGFHGMHGSNGLKSALTDPLCAAAVDNELEIFEMIIEFLRAGQYQHPLGLATLEAILKTQDEANLRRVLEFPSGVNVTVNQLIDCMKQASSRPAAVEMILRYKSNGAELSHATWQRLIEPVMGSLQEKTVVMLIDEFPSFANGTWQAIMSASISQHRQDILKVLLDRYSTHVDLHAYGQALLAAASSGTEECLRELLKFHHADLDQNKITFQKAFDCAAEAKQYGAMELLLADGRIGKYAGISHMLYKAAVEGRAEPTRSLLEQIKKINLQHSDDLHLALEGAAGNGCKETVEILLRYCQETNSLPENCYRSALNNAARNDHDDVVQLLLDQGPKDLSSRHAATFRDTGEESGAPMELEPSKAVDDEPLFNEDELDLDESDGDEDMSDAESYGELSDA